MDLDAFVSEHGAEWNRLQVLAGRRRRKLTAAEVDELVVLYRRTATHLSVVRSRSADPTLVAWLSRLVLQARAAVTPSAGFSVGGGPAVLRGLVPGRGLPGGPAGALGVAGWLPRPVAACSSRWWSTDPSIALAFLSQDEIDQLVNHDFEAYYSRPRAAELRRRWCGLNNALVTRDLPRRRGADPADAATCCGTTRSTSASSAAS